MRHGALVTMHTMPEHKLNYFHCQDLLALTRVNLKTHLFYPDRLTVHTETAFSVTENGTYFSKTLSKVGSVVWTAKTGENGTF